MNHLVLLDTQAGELGKILSGVKTMVVRAIDPAQPMVQPVQAGDSLYFLRDNGENILLVMASVVSVFRLENVSSKELSQTLKEMQPKLQLTEDQYNYWSEKQQVLLVEFGSAQKITVIPVEAHKIEDRSDWIPFEKFSLITK